MDTPTAQAVEFLGFVFWAGLILILATSMLLTRVQRWRKGKTSHSSKKTPTVRSAPLVSMQPAFAGHARYAADDLDFSASMQPEMQAVKLSTIAASDNVLVVGPKGSGKTTLLKTIVQRRASEECVALDPHASPGKWPCKTIGHGRDYGAIDSALRTLHAGMDARFKQLGRGEMQEGAYPRRSLVGDEFRSLAIALNGKEGTVSAGSVIASRITEGRKVGECALVASHNDTLEALGLPQGASALKTCFDYIVYLGGLAVDRAPETMKAALRRMDRPAVAYLTDKNQWFLLQIDLPLALGDVSVVPPSPTGGEGSPVIDEGTVMGGIPPHLTSAALVTSGDDLSDEAIITLHQAGWSRNKIVAQMRRGSKQDRLARIRSVLGEEVVAAETA
jgi:energy-coupling factor transporter ATP-binding protein EcfA2